MLDELNFWGVFRTVEAVLAAVLWIIIAKWSYPGIASQPTKDQRFRMVMIVVSLAGFAFLLCLVALYNALTDTPVTFDFPFAVGMVIRTWLVLVGWVLVRTWPHPQTPPPVP